MTLSQEAKENYHEKETPPLAQEQGLNKAILAVTMVHVLVPALGRLSREISVHSLAGFVKRKLYASQDWMVQPCLKKKKRWGTEGKKLILTYLEDKPDY